MLCLCIQCNIIWKRWYLLCECIKTNCNIIANVNRLTQFLITYWNLKCEQFQFKNIRQNISIKIVCPKHITMAKMFKWKNDEISSILKQSRKFFSRISQFVLRNAFGIFFSQNCSSIDRLQGTQTCSFGMAKGAIFDLFLNSESSDLWSLVHLFWKILFIYNK